MSIYQKKYRMVMRYINKQFLMGTDAIRILFGVESRELLTTPDCVGIRSKSIYVFPKHYIARYALFCCLDRSDFSDNRYFNLSGECYFPFNFFLKLLSHYHCVCVSNLSRINDNPKFPSCLKCK